LDKSFWYVGTVRHFRACVLPEIRRCGMRGLTLAQDYQAIQRRVDGATVRRLNEQGAGPVSALSSRDSEKQTCPSGETESRVCYEQDPRD